MAEAAGVALAVLGVLLLTVSSLGVLRMPDFFLRVHAPTKAATLGLMLLSAALALRVGEPGVWPRALFVGALVAITVPLGSLVLVRAAYRRGLPAVRPGARDDYAAFLRRRHGPPRREPPAPPGPV